MAQMWLSRGTMMGLWEQYILTVVVVMQIYSCDKRTINTHMYACRHTHKWVHGKLVKSWMISVDCTIIDFLIWCCTIVIQDDTTGGNWLNVHRTSPYMFLGNFLSKYNYFKIKSSKILKHKRDFKQKKNSWLVDILWF